MIEEVYDILARILPIIWVLISIIYDKGDLIVMIGALGVIVIIGIIDIKDELKKQTEILAQEGRVNDVDVAKR